MINRPKKDGPKRASGQTSSAKKHPRNEFADNEKPKRKRIDKGESNSAPRASKPKPWERMNQDKSEEAGSKGGFDKKRSSSRGASKDAKPFGDRKKDYDKPGRSYKPRGEKNDGFDKSSRFDKSDSDKPSRYSKSSRFDKPSSDKPSRFDKSDSDKPSRYSKSSRFDKPSSDKPSRFDKSDSDKPSRYNKSSRFDKPSSDKPSRFDKSDSDKPSRYSKSSRFDKPSSDKPSRFDKSDSDKPSRYSKSSRFDKPNSDKPSRFDKSDSDKPTRFNKSDRFDKSDSPKPSRYDKSGGDRTSAYDKPARFDKSDTEKPARFNKSSGYDKPGTKRSSGYGNSSRFEKSNKEGGNDFKGNDKKPYKSAKSKIEEPEEEGLIRLNRYISNSGICSRREADELIEVGAVSVNGKIITELGYKVRPGDKVNYGGETLNREKKVYLLLNKPKDYITTTDDPEKRKTVMELLKGACKERVYPVGRLDRATTGLLLFTNDGELAKRLTHPSHGAKKLYHVHLDNPLKKGDFDKIEAGLELEDGPIKVDQIVYAGDTGDKRELGVEIHSGKNRIVRRIFESLGYEVVKLDRVIFAGLTKKDLSRGRWRFLTEKEISMLNMIKK
jgi:23S rRNA pseudouridine2605 synthase